VTQQISVGAPPSDPPPQAGGWRGLFAGYVRLAARRPGAILLLFGLLAGLLLVPTLRLELHTDLAELLPNNHPGVVALRNISGRQKSSTNLVLIAVSPDPAANRRLVEALRPPLSAMIPSVFTEIQWRPETEVPEFFGRWRWLYAEPADLRSAEQLLERIIAQRSSPLLVDLEGDANAELRTLRQRLNQQLPARNDASYFEASDRNDAQRHLTGVMLWRRGEGLASLGDQQTLQAVQEVVRQIEPQRFHPQMQVVYSGPIAAAIEEHNAVRDDLSRVTVLCVSLVLLVIYLYFRRAALLLVIGAPAVLGVLMALALARLTIEYLNANTVFLISIILGNGINTPIILLARYGEERRRGTDVATALGTAMTETLLATITATAAASIAYGCLLLTSLRGFNQFGLVGGAGMLCVWAVTFLLVPPLVLTGERLRPGLLTPPPSLGRRPFTLLGELCSRRPLLISTLVLGATVAALVPAVRYGRDPIEYNFNNLRSTDPQMQRRWDMMYDLGMGNVGAGHIATDGVLLVDRADQADAVADALWQQDRNKGDRHILRAVRTLNKMVPKDQDEKLPILAHIRSLIDRHRELMSDEERQEVAAWRPPDDLHRLTVAELPRRIRENFTEVDGQIGRLVGIDADPDRYTEGDGRELIRLSRGLEVETLGKRWVAAATATVFAGMLETIEQDGPKVTLAALVGVTALVFIAFGLRGGLPVLLALAIGVTWLAGLVGVLSIKLNFLNFVALPITLGIGTEYATNIWARLRRGGVSMATVLGDTGSAVALCSLTTIIGYSSLLLARNRALQSFGRVAYLGELTCLLAALLALPALLALVARYRRRP
jgi:predicted RND superfamily exporter protein